MSTKERLRRIRFALVPLGRPIDVSARPLDFENRFPRLRKKRREKGRGRERPTTRFARSNLKVEEIRHFRCRLYRNRIKLYNGITSTCLRLAAIR